VGARALGRNSTLFAVILNVCLSRNLDQSMLENAYFLENCKNRLSIGGSAPEPPVGLRRLGAPLPDPRVVSLVSYYNPCRVYFLVENAFYSAQKRNK